MSKRILIVDDDSDYLFQMSTHVRKMGYEVIAASSQREAEKIIGELRPDLAIFDLMMENDDSGFILCHKMRTTHPGVPIIIATAVAAETGIHFGLEGSASSWVKADLYLEKAIRPAQLEEEITKLLNTR